MCVGGSCGGSGGLVTFGMAVGTVFQNMSIVKWVCDVNMVDKTKKCGTTDCAVQRPARGDNLKRSGWNGSKTILAFKRNQKSSPSEIESEISSQDHNFFFLPPLYFAP